MVSQAIKVFISYSHADASLVRPVVQLLRANRSLVFQDLDQITPGKKWREELERGLTEANLVVVFWCAHSGGSPEVAGEWQKAIALKKDVLPLLLDGTPLPGELGEYQWIDFRGAVGGNHGQSASYTQQAGTVDSAEQYGRSYESGRRSARPGPAASMPRQYARGPWVAALAASVVAVTVGLGWYFLFGASPHASLPSPGDVPSVPADEVSAHGWLWYIAVLVGVLVAWRILRRLIFAPPSIERQIARKLEAEIMRRGSSSSSRH